MTQDPLLRRATPLAAFWFLGLAPHGLFLPFYGLYLRENVGLSGSELGLVFATLPLFGLLMQPFWGTLADRTGLRARVLVLIAAGAAGGYLAVGLAQHFVALLAATALLATFVRSLIPLTVAASLPALEDKPHAFGIVRAFGTLGFLVAVLSFPPLLDRFQAARGLVAVPGGPSEPGLELLFPIAASLAAVAAVAAFAIPNRGAVATQALPGEWRGLLRNPHFRAVVVVGFCAFLCINGPMEQFPILVRARGGDLDTVRAMWVPMLVPEAVLIALLGTTVRRLGARTLLRIGIAAGGIRWLLSAHVDSLAWLLPVQALHGVTVAGLMIGAPLYVDAVIPAQLRSTAQTTFATLAVGLGGIGSSLLAGVLLEWTGPEAPYLAGGAGAVVLALLLPRILPALPARTEDRGGG